MQKNFAGLREESLFNLRKSLAGRLTSDRADMLAKRCPTVGKGDGEGQGVVNPQVLPQRSLALAGREEGGEGFAA